MNITAIVLCGDREATKNIQGQNKAFLKIEQYPVVHHVLMALDEARYVNRVIVVGPEFKIKKYASDWTFSTPITILDQRANVYENSWYAFLHSLPEDYSKLSLSQIERRYRNHSVLIVAADIPLLVGAEVDHFIDSIQKKEHDVIFGYSSEDTLKQFYPTRTRPGIRLMYFYLNEALIRHSNIMIVKPFCIKNRDYIRRMYTMRHQQKIMQVIKLMFNLIKIPERSIHILFHYLILQLSMNSSRLGLTCLLPYTRRAVNMDRICAHISLLLDARCCLVENPLGGAALDMDNVSDYIVMRQMFRVWKANQRCLAQKLGVYGCTQ